MNDISVSYHALGDVNFSATVEFVPKREVFGEHYHLKLGQGFRAFCTRRQLQQIQAAIQEALEPAESDESYEASEALLQYRRPDRVGAALRKYVTEQNCGVHSVFAPILEAICPTESDLEQARRMR